MNITLPPANLSANVNLSNITNITNQTNKTPIVYSRSGGGGGGGSSSDDDEEEPPILPTCNDGILNQDEDDIDCGGVCTACSNYLVQDGVALADIIVALDAPNMTQLGAEYFQKYIYNITNVTLPLSNTTNISYDFHVYIGESAYTDALGINSTGCVNSGFKIVSGENYLVLLGDDSIMSIAGVEGVPGPQDYSEWDALTGTDYFTNDYLDYYENSYNDEHDIWEEDGRGSLNAVFEFLYGQGVRWYHPGWYEHPGIGTIIPSDDDIVFQNINTTINPDFAMREFYLYSMGFGNLGSYQYDGQSEEQLQWVLSLRGNSYYNFLIGSLGGPGHGIRAVIAREETESAHPEYYATLDGELMNESNPVPNLCSPELLDANVRYVKKMFDVYNISMVSVMPTDGFTSADDNCKYMETPERGFEGLLSNYVWEYTNNLAWEIYADTNYSGKKIFAGAYTTYQMPPDDLSQAMAPNIAVVVTKWRTWTADPVEKEYYKNVTQEWVNLLGAENVYTYDYYLHNLVGSETQSVPIYFPQILADDFAYLDGRSNGEIMEISSTSTWPPYDFVNSTWDLEWDAFAATSLNTYITARLYWNNTENVTALLDEYYGLYYGPANSSMKAFVEYSEAHISDVLQDPSVIVTMRQMLEDARELAGDNVYGYRIDLLRGLMNSTGPSVQSIDDCQDLTYPSVTFELTTDVTSTGTCFTVGNGGITLDCQGHNITYGTSGTNGVHGVYMPYTSGIYTTTVKNCNFMYNGPGDGDRVTIEFPTSIGAKILNNTFYVNNTGIWFIDSDDVTVVGNRIHSTSSNPFATQEVRNGTVTNNTFSGLDAGTYLYGTMGVNFVGNNVSSIDGYGLQLTQTNNSIFMNNIYSSVNSAGLNTYESYNNTFSNNTEIP